MTTLREAAQQALEALEGLSEPYYVLKAQDALKAALEQPEQEPVAWTTMPHTDDWLFVSGAMKPSLPGDWHPLYTHPRREWRGLTDTERAAVQHESFKRGLSPLEFMELHEAKLKEKNT